MTTFVARLCAAWWLLQSSVEAAQRVSPQTHPDAGFGGYEEWSDTEIIILLSLAFACVVVFLIVGLALNRRTRQQRQRNPRKVITAADVEHHFPVSNTDEEPTCAVCLSTIEVDEPCRRTQCGHEFHADCIMQWWTHKPRKVLRCPICRRRQHVKHDKGLTESGSDLKLELPPVTDQEIGPAPPDLEEQQPGEQGEQPSAEAGSQEERSQQQPGQPEGEAEESAEPQQHLQPQQPQEQPLQPRQASGGYPQTPSQQGPPTVAAAQAGTDEVGASGERLAAEIGHPLEVCITVAKNAIETITAEDRVKQEI